MRIFRNNINNKGKTMKYKLWKYSRHPNYLGEIGFWFSMLLFGYASTGSMDGWMSVGFFTMVVLFVFVSIPMIEKKMNRDKQGYADYQAATFALLPLSRLRR